MVKLVHISDVHFGDACAAKLEAASRAINAVNPACVIVTGDLTQAGKRAEFDQAALWLQTIRSPIVACPGNHDTPMYNLTLRLLDPFGRFAKLGLLSSWQSDDGCVHIEAANSARGLQWRLDWSQGDYQQPQLNRALKRLGESGARHRILALHHPPETPDGAAVTSEPSGLEVFARRLSQIKPDLLLCGHVHAAFDFPAKTLAGIRVMTVPSLASSRERGFGAGFAVLGLQSDDPVISRSLWRFQSGAFLASNASSECSRDIAGRYESAATA